MWTFKRKCPQILEMSTNRESTNMWNVLSTNPELFTNTCLGYRNTKQGKGSHWWKDSEKLQIFDDRCHQICHQIILFDDICHQIQGYLSIWRSLEKTGGKGFLTTSIRQENSRKCARDSSSTFVQQ